MRLGTLRVLVIGFAVAIGGLAVVAVAEGWRRPAAFAVSSSEGGVYKACRDGITFQVAINSPEPIRFEVYSPPAEPNATPAVVAEGEFVPEPVTPPLELDLGDTYNYLGTETVLWTGGRLLDPGPASLEIGIYELTSAHQAGADAVSDCFLFPPNVRQCKKGAWRRWGLANRRRCIAFVKQYARKACLAEREADEALFREKYGKGKRGRHALKTCVRESI